MRFLEAANGKASYGGINFFNIEGKYILDCFEEVVSLINKSFLIITAVDGAVDNYLEKALKAQGTNFELYQNACFVYPESSATFIKYIEKIPCCALFCCREKPLEGNIKELACGYVEEFGSISKNTGLMKNIYKEMEMLNSFLYHSQGACNLFIGLRL